MPLLALTALAMMPAVYGQACTRGFLAYGDTCHLVGMNAPTMSYPKAEQWCSNKGATLVKAKAGTTGLG